MMMMEKIRPFALSVALLTGLALQDAGAAISVTAFSPASFSNDTNAMNLALGINGFLIEDFEDTSLISGLSYQLTNPNLGTFTSLPSVFNAASAPFLSNRWDGAGVLINNSANNFPSEGTRASAITFLVAGGARSFGVGLSNFQSLSLPPSEFPVTDHQLTVNGISFGLLEALHGWVPGRQLRNLYLRIDASGTDTISTIGFTNLATSPIDLVVFDHIAVKAIPSPASILCFAPAVLGLSMLRRRRRPSP